MKLLASALFALATSAASAKPVMTVTCGEPTGIRFDRTHGAVNTNEDGFTGVNPLFILDDENPARLTVVWGPAMGAKELLGAETKATEAVIVAKTVNQITAVAADPSGDAVLLYSLYPNDRIVYFTQHRYILHSVPNSSSYHAACEFAFK